MQLMAPAAVARAFVTVPVALASPERSHALNTCEERAKEQGERHTANGKNKGKAPALLNLARPEASLASSLSVFRLSAACHYQAIP